MFENVIGHEDIKYKLKSIIPNLPRVILFSGPEGVGKKHTALNFIDEINKGQLKGKLFSHPDIYLFKPDSKVFKLELVDKIKNNLYTTPHSLDRKYFIIDKIDLMNKESANACLKILEECPDYIYFILIADNIENVLDTIKSRSVFFEFLPIPNLKNFFPELDDLTLSLIRGSIGKKDKLQKVDLKALYEDINNLIDNFISLRYSEILEWFTNKESYDLELILDLMLIATNKAYLENNNNLKYNLFIESLNSLKEIFHTNVNIKNQFKNNLIQLKYNLDKIN